MTVTNSNGTTGCRRSNVSDFTGQSSFDYYPFLNPFQYSPHRKPTARAPTSVQMIGYANDGDTNHQYDIHDFFDAVKA